MKKIIILALFSLFTLNTMMAQASYTLDSNSNELINDVPEKKEDIKTKYYVIIKETVYPVYLTSSGKWYIKRISSKTHLAYKSYIDVKLAK